MAWDPNLLNRLNDQGVDYLVVGGVAALAHGSTRFTEDLDILAPLDHGNAVRIIQALHGTRPRWRMRPDLPVVTPDNPQLRGLKNMYLRCDLGQLDVLGELSGVGTFVELAPRALRAEVEGIACPVLDLDSLIAAKTFAGREKDKPALHELRRIRDSQT